MSGGIPFHLWFSPHLPLSSKKSTKKTNDYTKVAVACVFLTCHLYTPDVREGVGFQLAMHKFDFW